MVKSGTKLSAQCQTTLNRQDRDGRCHHLWVFNDDVWGVWIFWVTPVDILDVLSSAYKTLDSAHCCFCIEENRSTLFFPDMGNYLKVLLINTFESGNVQQFIKTLHMCKNKTSAWCVEKFISVLVLYQSQGKEKKNPDVLWEEFSICWVNKNTAFGTSQGNWRGSRCYLMFQSTV